MSTFIHTYMCRHYLHGVFHEGCSFYPWATWQGTLTTFGAIFAFSLLVTWFIFGVIKPEPGCLYEGPLPFGFYMGRPR